MLSFTVVDAFDLGDDGWEPGATLIGPPIEHTDATLRLGDRLRVFLVDGSRREFDVVQFPLIRLPDGQERWVRVTIGGISDRDVLLDAVAEGVAVVPS